jgi:hypothetical protein
MKSLRAKASRTSLEPTFTQLTYWIQSVADDCVYYNGNVIFVVYVDDRILTSPSPENVRKCLDEMYQLFNITKEGDLCGYVGVNIEKK